MGNISFHDCCCFRFAVATACRQLNAILFYFTFVFCCFITAEILCAIWAIFAYLQYLVYFVDICTVSALCLVFLLTGTVCGLFALCVSFVHFLGYFSLFATC